MTLKNCSKLADYANIVYFFYIGLKMKAIFQQLPKFVSGFPLLRFIGNKSSSFNPYVLYSFVKLTRPVVGFTILIKILRFRFIFQNSTLNKFRIVLDDLFMNCIPFKQTQKQETFQCHIVLQINPDSTST